MHLKHKNIQTRRTCLDKTKIKTVV